MTGALGNLSIGAGLAAALIACILWWAAALSDKYVRAARWATGTMVLAAALGLGALEWALITHDFSVGFVAENGGRHVPLYFTITSVWSALDGSIMLWVFVLSAAAALLAAGTGRRPTRERAWALAVVTLVAVFFFALILFAANPFERTGAVPADGPGPNPLLREHPAMGVHPPLLYAGYVGMVVPFGLAVAALITGGNDDAWLRSARRWALGAWVLLTAGIVLGAWWSYAVLGWGGYWAWDPVENASLLPWLTSTAALHVTMVRHRSDRRGWAVALFCATFLLVLLGTFLTRSGVIASIHSFTESPLGPMLLAFTILIAAIVTALLIRGPGHDPPPSAPPWRWWARDTALLYQAALLLTITAVVLVGTLYPLISQLMSGSQAAVDTAYFTRTAVPLFLAVLLLMGVWQLSTTDGGLASRTLIVPVSAGLLTVVVVGIFWPTTMLALTTFGLAAFVSAGVVTTARRGGRAGLAAHLGVAVIAIGIAASASYGQANTGQLRPGDAISVGGVTATLTGVDREAGPDRTTVSARLSLADAGGSFGAAAPLLHHYPGRDSTVGAPAIITRPTGDVYVTLTAVDPAGPTATVRLAVNPFVWLLWLGGLIVAGAGATALLQSRLRGEGGSPSADGSDVTREPAGVGS
ncbi:heme lyase CcmF/NrfE family subunit [Mycobacterium sp. PSTR-4-N]|uniref:heme lyase CcmF/NrfE family subunit n=1 Tax=Mycobacterium sp. PSTR-4-N TaxID=2917745 RepID=UPI001F151DEF|nr:cytochrome c-type biogenesis CcmF C-terminal domain-containing protein [Mycobacterium sp. PSTR-4-N]MCG7593745.1 cytochrome c biogenesis protein CcsA [Mycobacterium sp. PSTR-4-N]